MQPQASDAPQSVCSGVGQEAQLSRGAEKNWGNALRVKVDHFGGAIYRGLFHTRIDAGFIGVLSLHVFFISPSRPGT